MLDGGEAGAARQRTERRRVLMAGALLCVLVLSLDGTEVREATRRAELARLQAAAAADRAEALARLGLAASEADVLARRRAALRDALAASGDRELANVSGVYRGQWTAANASGDAVRHTEWMDGVWVVAPPLCPLLL